MENTSNDLSTRSVGIKYGAFSGLAGIVMFLITVVTSPAPMQGGWSSWVSMAISVTLLVLAHKNFKDSGDGFMSYGQGIGIGFWFTLVGSVLSVIVMYLYLNVIDPSAMDSVYEQQALKMEEQGQSEEAIEVAMEWTKKLFWPIAIVGSLFVGMIIALIVTIFTQKKNQEATF
jgi:Protein of unknown function (DUF4199)